MGLLVALSFTAEDSAAKAVLSELSSLAEPYEYKLYLGIPAREQHMWDMTDGLQQLADLRGWNTIILVYTQNDKGLPFARKIAEEFNNFRSGRGGPPFLNFLEEANQTLADQLKSYTVSFSDEWPKDTDLRLYEGSLTELLTLLKGPGGWMIEVFNPAQQIYRVKDEWPLVFTVHATPQDSP